LVILSFLQEIIKNANIEDTNIIKVVFPSTVITNKYFSGELIYDKNIDTLDFYNLKKRMIIFVSSKDSTSLTFDDIYKTSIEKHHDSSKSKIVKFPFKVKYTKPGKKDLKLSIKDIVFLVEKDTITGLTMLESTTVYHLPINVLDSNSIAGYKEIQFIMLEKEQ